MSEEQKKTSKTSHSMRRLNDYQRRKIRRMQDKANNLCAKCHKPLDRTGAYCSSCLDYYREYQNGRKELLLSLKLCTVCGVNDIFDGENTCPECKAKKYTNARKDAERDSERKKEIRRERASEGLCTKCGKPLDDPSHKTCSECREKLRLYRQRKQKPNVREERKSQLLCAICGKDELVPGKYVCQDCYRIGLDAINKCRQNRGEGYNQKWKDSNMKIRSRYKIKKYE